MLLETIDKEKENFWFFGSNAKLINFLGSTSTTVMRRVPNFDSAKLQIFKYLCLSVIY